MGGVDADVRFMARALDLARAQLGRVAPNPSVGCVIVKDRVVIAEAATGDGGRPHGEEIALLRAGDGARGATAYISLEPCARRTSATPSCAQRLVDAGIARAVIACREPNPNSAHGAAALEAAGVQVSFGTMEASALALNQGFFKLISTGRPWLAVSADASAYDADFSVGDGETLEASLERMGAAGLTRVRIDPAQSELIARLQGAGLIDETAS